jgi:hypothetical protein
LFYNSLKTGEAFHITDQLSSYTMALLGMGIFYGGIITGVPVVTGVAEGVRHQKEANAEAANETRMVKFYIDVFCDAASPRKGEVHGTMLVLKDDKVAPLAPHPPTD